MIGLNSLTGLDVNVAERLAMVLGLEDKPVRIAIQDERSLNRNQDIAVARLTQLVTQALAPPPPPRRPTRPSRAKREARLANKTRRARVKRLRQEPSEE